MDVPHLGQIHLDPDVFNFLDLDLDSPQTHWVCKDGTQIQIRESDESMGSDSSDSLGL